jgi:hypothetical protein
MPMSRRPIRLVTSLLVVVGLVGAAEQPMPFSGEGGTAPTPRGPGAGLSGPAPVGMGSFGQAAERQVFIQGLVDLDYLANNNFADGSGDLSDSRHQGLLRGELGARIELDERLEVKLTLAYDAETGDRTWTQQGGEANPGEVVMDDAYVVLKEFLGRPNLGVQAGRQPVAWNLRTDYGAFLYDSRADDPDVTSWDGVRGSFAIETLTFLPYAYALPDQSTLYGIALDWQPAQGESNGLFITGSANLVRDPIVYGTTGAGLTTPAQLGDTAGVEARSQYTYYGGAEMRFDNGLDLFLEGAIQRGSGENDITFSGYGLSSGITWHPRTVNQMAFGVQGDWLRGDDDNTDAKIRSFQNPWEGVQDTLIAEHEKYGEVARYPERAGTGLRAGKLTGELAIDRANRFRLRSVYAYYLLDQAPIAGNGSKDFGQELDLGLVWQYDEADKARIGLMGGVFQPGRGFSQIAPSQPADQELLWMFATNLEVAF